MRKIIAFILIVLCVVLAGCTDTDYIAEIKEEARTEGYENGYSDGYEEALYECGRVANNELRDAGLRDAQEHVSMIETILDAPDDFDTSDIGVHISAIKEYLNDIDGIIEQYDKHGIEP